MLGSPFVPPMALLPAVPCSLAHRRMTPPEVKQSNIARAAGSPPGVSRALESVAERASPKPKPTDRTGQRAGEVWAPTLQRTPSGFRVQRARTRGSPGEAADGSGLIQRHAGHAARARLGVFETALAGKEERHRALPRRCQILPRPVLPRPVFIPKQLGLGFNKTCQQLCFQFSQTL